MNKKQRRFAEQYLLDLNATQAAIRAGYSEKTAHSQGPRLLDNVEVADYIKKKMDERSERTKIDADWVLKRLGEEAEADLLDILTEEGSLKPVSEWPLIWRQGLVDGIDIEELYEGRGAERENIGRVYKVKMGHRIKRVELIGRHVNVQAFKDKIEHGVDSDMAEMLKKARRASGKGDE